MPEWMDLSDEFERLKKSMDGKQGAVVGKISEEYAQALDNLRETIRKKYDRYAEAGELTYDKMAKYDRIKKLDKELAEAARQMHVETSKITRSSLRDVYRSSFQETKGILGDAAGRTIRGKVKHEVVQEALQNPVSGLTLNDRLSRHRGRIISEIQETIGQGLVNGETYSEMSSRLKDYLEDDVVKARRIVRTETHRVMEDAKYKGVEHAHKQGVDLRKYWLDAQDERVREAGEGNHVGMGEKYSKENAIPVDENFVNDETGGEGPAPGQLGTAIDDINCRCIMVTIVVTD